MEGANTTDTPRLVVVVLTWNGRDDTLACLDALRDQLGPRDGVVVVDNGSEDGTEVAVREAHPWAEFLQNGANLGFAGGNNVGLRRALERGCEWVLILNNDTTPPAGALDALVAEAERTGADVLQPLLVRAPDGDVVDSAGVALRRLVGFADARMGEPVANAPAEAVEVFGACAAAALVRASALRAAGLFDESLFVLCEDVDLMFRLRMAGHRVWLTPRVRVPHGRGISGAGRSADAARRRRFWLQRNTVAQALRYWPLRWLLLAAPVLLFRALHALWLARGLDEPGGERCGPLWRASRAARAANRRALREHDVDRWFGAREA